MSKLRFVITVTFIILFNGCGGENLTGVADKVLVAPTAVAGEDVHIRTDANVTLTAKDSFDEDGSLIAYSWEENGTILSTGIELKNYSSKIIGKHTITLRVLDNDELNASDTVDIYVTLENQRPTAEAGDDKKIKVGDTVTIDGNGSSDVDGKIVFYEWKVKDSTEVLSTGVQLKDYAPKTEAIYILELTVTDNEGLSDTDTVYVSVINNKVPIANAGNDQSIRVGESITLDGSRSNDADGTIDTYSWEEGGVVLGTGERLIDYAPTTLGDHTLTFTVTDNDGESNSDTVVVTVRAANVAPIADAGDNKNIRASESITLDGSGSSDSDGTIAQYVWKEGLTELGTGSTLNYSSTVEGVHAIELTVTDNEGLTHTDTVHVTVVANSSPIANAGNDQSIRVGESITLDGSRSNDADGTIDTYSWEEGGVVLGTGERLIDYAPTTLGDHTLTFTVTDNDGESNSDTVVVTVRAANVAPIADAGDNKNIRASESITLDGSGSSDSDGTIAQYVWKEGLTELGTGSTLNYSSTVEGVHAIELTVTDNEGLTHTDTVHVTVVANSSPIANAGNDQSIRVGESITLDGSRSNDADGTIDTYSWEEGGVVLGTGERLIDYAPTTLGDHTLTFTVTDNDGESNSDTVVVTVRAANVAPIADAGDNKNIRASESITLDGSGSSDSDGTIAQYVWKEGLTELGTGSTLNYSSTVEGVHAIELTVTDNEGLTHTDTVHVTVVANSSPIANAGNDQSIRVGESITLDGSRSNDADGTIDTYSWEEGGVVLGTGERLIDYAPTTLGDHTLTFTVTDNDGESNSDTVVVTVRAANVAPIADAGDNKNIRASESITLDGSGSSDSDGTIAQYVWKEGLTELGTGSTLNYSSTVEGVHAIELTVTDNEGLTHTDTVHVTVVANSSPIANAGNDQSIRVGESITLDGSRSNDADGTIDTYSWEEGGVVLGTGERLIDYAPTTLGDHTLTFTVTDNDGESNSDTVVVTVRAANVAPIADAGDNKNIRASESITLDGSGSSDSDGTIAQYVWKEGLTELGTGSTLNYSSTVEGVHAIELTVTDNEGLTHTDTVHVTVVANSSPIANAGNDQSIRVGESITLDGSQSNDADGTIDTYSWEEGGVVLGTGERLIDYAPTTLGDHTLTFTVTDNDGESNSDTVVVTVRAANVAPIADAGDNKNIRASESITLDGSGSSDSDGTIAQYVWKEGLTELGTGSTLNYSSTVEGVHAIELTVTDNEGLTHTDTVHVTVVANSSPIANAGNDQSIRVGESITLDGSRSNDADGTIDTYSWEEGGVVLGTGERLIDYAPTTLGDHTLTFTVTDNDGESNSDTVVVTVRAANVAPIADAGDNKNIRASESITLDGSGSSDSDGTIAQYVWKEGLTELGTGSTLNYSSTVEGVHAIELTVTDNEGLTHTDTVHVTVVANSSPIANAGNDQSIRVGESITLDGSQSNDADGTIDTYSWEEGGVVLGTGERLIDYAPTTLGDHTLTFTVTDNDGESNSDTVVVTVRAANVAPIADAGDNKNIRASESITLDGSGSSDSDGTIAQYVWKEGLTELGTGSTLNYSSTVEGVHAIELTVTDNEGLTHTDTVHVTVVANSSPIANAGNDQSIRVGESITLDGSRSNDADGTIDTYSWEEGGVVLGTGERLIDYAPTTLGDHTLTFTVTDNDGESNSDTVVVTVRAANVAPIADAGADKTVAINTNVTLDGTASSDSDGTIIYYEWSEGGTILGTAVNLVYSSAYEGGHTIVLKVRDNEGLEHTDSVYVIVTN